MNKWRALAQAFYNIGTALEDECSWYATSEPDFEQLYINYVQMLETIKVQRTIIHNRHSEIGKDFTKRSPRDTKM